MTDTPTAQIIVAPDKQLAKGAPLETLLADVHTQYIPWEEYMGGRDMLLALGTGGGFCGALMGVIEACAPDGMMPHPLPFIAAGVATLAGCVATWIHFGKRGSALKKALAAEHQRIIDSYVKPVFEDAVKTGTMAKERDFIVAVPGQPSLIAQAYEIEKRDIFSDHSQTPHPGILVSAWLYKTSTTSTGLIRGSRIRWSHGDGGAFTFLLPLPAQPVSPSVSCAKACEPS